MGTKLRIVFLYKAQAVCDRVFYDGKEKEKKRDGLLENSVRGIGRNSK